MSDEPSSPSSARGRRGLVVALLAVLVLGIGVWRAWAWWQARAAQERTAATETGLRLAALEQRVDALRGDQRKQAQRLQDMVATHRVLRDEVLGLGQRGALLEESVAKLTDPNRHGPQALRLDEVELLLSTAAQRLAIAHDLEGARRAYALAAGALDGVDDHRLLNLKQALAQERTALDALGAGGQADRIARLDALDAAVRKLQRDGASTAATAGETRTTWQRVLSPLVDVRPTRDRALVAPSQRATAEAALQIELSLARAAVERGNDADYRAALARIDAWLPQLWADTPALRNVRAQLQAMKRAPAPAQPAVMGSTLQQLRALRNAGVQLRLPASPPSAPEATP